MSGDIKFRALVETTMSIEAGSMQVSVSADSQWNSSAYLVVLMIFRASASISFAGSTPITVILSRSSNRSGQVDLLSKSIFASSGLAKECSR
jgi:hypothetical protein